MGELFRSELLGTAVMLTLGVGVSANAALPRTKGRGSAYVVCALGWALGVMCGVYLAPASGAHLNPAVTFARVVEGSGELAPGISTTPATVAVYVVAQLLGAFLGACLAWCAYRTHFEPGAPAAGSVTVFATGPDQRDHVASLVAEAVGTGVLVLVVLEMGRTPSGLGPFGTALVVLGVGLGLGGPTGWALNPARDLGARLAHALLPVRGRTTSDWGYAWVPVAGPLLGGAAAALVSAAW